ncbi:Endoglucanase precursor [compost metagenome]
MSGVGDGIFAPDQEITREEMTAVLMKLYEKDMGVSVSSVAEKQDSGFLDLDMTSQWALDYVKAAQTIGLVKGMPDGTFQPKARALREQAAKLLYEYLELSARL